MLVTEHCSQERKLFLLVLASGKYGFGVIRTFRAREGTDQEIGVEQLHLGLHCALFYFILFFSVCRTHCFHQGGHVSASCAF